MKVVGIDPGLQGAFVTLENGKMSFASIPYNDKEIDFDKVVQILKQFKGSHIFLERAMPLAMGAKHAFNYGRAFMALEIAVKLSGLAVTYVEPSKWVKVMHDGISKDLKPKAKSIIAVERLFPKLIDEIPKTPKSKKLHEGVVDALLIAGYGLRVLGSTDKVSVNDF